MTASTASHVVRRPVAALLFTVAVVLAAVAGVAAPLIAARETKREIDDASARLAALKQAGRDGRGLESGADGAMLLPGGSTGRSAAELQIKVSALARVNGVDIRTSNVLAQRREEQAGEVTVEFGFQTRIDALRSFLLAIETGAPLLVVDEIDVRALPRPPERPPGPMDIEVSMRVRGFAAAQERP